MKNKKLKALLSKTVAVGIAASMTAGVPVMAEDIDTSNSIGGGNGLSADSVTQTTIYENSDAKDSTEKLTDQQENGKQFAPKSAQATGFREKGTAYENGDAKDSEDQLKKDNPSGSNTTTKITSSTSKKTLQAQAKEATLDSSPNRAPAEQNKNSKYTLRATDKTTSSGRKLLEVYEGDYAFEDDDNNNIFVLSANDNSDPDKPLVIHITNHKDGDTTTPENGDYYLFFVGSSYSFSQYTGSFYLGERDFDTYINDSAFPDRGDIYYEGYVQGNDPARTGNGTFDFLYDLSNDNNQQEFTNPNLKKSSYDSHSVAEGWKVIRLSKSDTAHRFSRDVLQSSDGKIQVLAERQASYPDPSDSGSKAYGPFKVSVDNNNSDNVVPKGKYWVDPSAYLIYAEDVKDNSGKVLHKKGDRVVVSETSQNGKTTEYYISYAFTSLSDNDQRNFLKVIKDNIVDNKAEGLDIQMYDWDSDKQHSYMNKDEDLKDNLGKLKDSNRAISLDKNQYVVFNGGGGKSGILFSDNNGNKYFLRKNDSWWDKGASAPTKENIKNLLGKNFYYYVCGDDYGQNQNYFRTWNSLSRGLNGKDDDSDKSGVTRETVENGTYDKSTIFVVTLDPKDARVAKIDTTKNNQDGGNAKSCGTIPSSLSEYTGEAERQKMETTGKLSFTDDIYKQIKNSSVNISKDDSGSIIAHFFNYHGYLFAFASDDVDTAFKENKDNYFYFSGTNSNQKDHFDVLVNEKNDDSQADNWVYHSYTPDDIKKNLIKDGKTIKPYAFLLTLNKNSSIKGSKNSDRSITLQKYVGQNGPGSGVFGPLGSELKNGFPDIAAVYRSTNQDNLAELFNKEKLESYRRQYTPQNNNSFTDTTGLLQLNDEGYFVYDSNHNFATLYPSLPGKQGDTIPFTIFKDTGVGNTDDKSTYHSGNFLPYDSLNPSDPDTKGQTTYKYNKDDDFTGKQYYTKNARGENTDYNFGMVLSGKFVQGVGGQYNGKDMIYHFSGDDDMAVYIDGKLVLDLTGIHDASDGTIDFSTGEITANGYTRNSDLKFADDGILPFTYSSVKNNLGDDVFGFDKSKMVEVKEEDGSTGYRFADGSVHDIKVFYMERGRGASDLKLKMALPTAKDKTVNSQVTKKWNDSDDKYGRRPKDKDGKSYATFTFERKLKGEDDSKWVKTDWDRSTPGDQYTVTLSDANDWNVIARNLPRYDDKGEEFEYRWVENTSDDYGVDPGHDLSKDYDTKGDSDVLSQIWNFVNTLLTKTSVKQEWRDADDKYHKRPDSIKMRLSYSTDGQYYKDYDFDPSTPDVIDAAILDNGNDWFQQVSLPKYDKDGKEINYTYKWTSDSKVGFYSPSVTISGDALNQSYSIVNTLQAETSVTKNWDDDNDKDGVRPKSIQMTLHRVDINGKDTVVKTVDVAPDQDGNWKTHETVDRADEKGKELKYYWTEGDVSAYEQSVYQKNALGDSSLDEETVITNKHTPKADPQATPSEPVKPQPDPDSESGQPEVNPISDSSASNTGNTDVHPVEPKDNNQSKSDEKKSETPTAKADVKPTAVSPQKTVTKTQITVKPAATVNSTAKTSVTKTSTAKTTDEVKTADEGHTGRNAAAMTLSAAMLGLAAMFTRKRKQNHNR